jgi:uncharacterized membrane protein
MGYWNTLGWSDHMIGWRKFIAYIIACILVWFDKISDEIWVIFAVIFIGGNIAAKYLPGKKE